MLFEKLWTIYFPSLCGQIFKWAANIEAYSGEPHQEKVPCPWPIFGQKMGPSLPKISIRSWARHYHIFWSKTGPTTFPYFFGQAISNSLAHCYPAFQSEAGPFAAPYLGQMLGLLLLRISARVSEKWWAHDWSTFFGEKLGPPLPCISVRLLVKVGPLQPWIWVRYTGGGMFKCKSLCVNCWGDIHKPRR